MVIKWRELGGVELVALADAVLASGELTPGDRECWEAYRELGVDQAAAEAAMPALTEDQIRLLLALAGPVAGGDDDDDGDDRDWRGRCTRPVCRGGPRRPSG